MKRAVSFLLACVLALLPVCGMTSCGFDIRGQGLDYYREHNVGLSEMGLTSERFLTPAFLDEYPYTDGNFLFTFTLIYAHDFPRCFNAFGYNDETRTLVFIGFYISYDHKDVESSELAVSDFGAFLEHYFPDWYAW